MSRRPALSTDEARTAFCASAAALLAALGDRPQPSELGAVLSGTGRVRKSSRALYHRHCEVLREIRDAGHGWLLDDEIEGVQSCIEDAGCMKAAAVLASQLPADADAYVSGSAA